MSRPSLPRIPPHRYVAASASLPTPTDLPSSVAGKNPIFAQAMLRIVDPTASRAFYQDALGMSFLTRLDFPDLQFSLFFYAYTDDQVPDQTDPQPKRAEWLWGRPYPTVELTWNWPKETYEESVQAAAQNDKGDEVYVNGNEDPKGFGYIGVVVSNLSGVVTMLEKKGVPVVQGISTKGEEATAIIADPDGYLVQLTERGHVPVDDDLTMVRADPVYGSVMLRVKDPREAIKFFARLGFRYIARVDHEEGKCTEYFLAYSLAKGLPDDIGNGEKMEWVHGRRECKILLMHHWGTEEEREQVYTNGNTKPYRGYGHVGIIMDDIYATTQAMEKDGYKIVRQPAPFKDVGEISFVAEPSTGYWVEIIKRAGIAADEPYEKPFAMGL